MNFKTLLFSLVSILFIGSTGFSQIIIEGYAFESGNRGFLNQVVVNATNSATAEYLAQGISDTDGKFMLEVPPGVGAVTLTANKNLFHEAVIEVDTKDVTGGKAFVKVEMKRAPGYIFEITLAEKKDSIDQPVDQIKGALIEVYNNTKKKPELVLTDHPDPEFKVNLLKGNHYTLMIRKKGYLAKRMEAFVDVKGCILCFEGIGEVRPDVADNLSEGNTMGTLLANVELDRMFEGKSIEIPNIYYDLNSAEIRPDAASELDKAATFLRDNPEITVELGSHTDARGKSEPNMKLSLERARSAVEYLANEGKVEPYRMSARGYGESKIINKCKNGVKCSESDHARNRRTEIKILGIVQNFEYKSLEKIKYEEGLDDLIAELQNQEQVKVPAGGNLPPDFDADNLGGAKDVEAEMVDEKVAVEKSIVVEETKAVMQEKVSDVIVEETKAIVAEKVDEPMVEEVAKQVVVEEVIEKTMENKVDELVEESATSITETKPVIEKEMVKPPVVQKPMKPQTTKMKTSNKQNAASLAGFTGHKIVLHYSDNALPTTNRLYNDFEDLIEYKAKAGFYLYLTGNFTDKNNAINQMMENYKSKFPNAYIVEFENGKRVN